MVPLSRSYVSHAAPKFPFQETPLSAGGAWRAWVVLAVEGESCNGGTPKPHDMNTAAGRRGGHGWG